MSQISVNNLTFSYENSSNLVFDRVSFCVDTSWRLGFCGRNGRGKTTLLKLLMGKYEYSGTINSNIEFDYFPQEVANANYLVQDVLEELAPNAEAWQLKKELKLLNVDDDILYSVFSTLSFGEQTKVKLVALFCSGDKFLLIDEPTNHLDAIGRKTVANYLKSKSGFILVSHDRVFLDNCVDHILSINRNDISITKGNFSTWWQEKERQDNFELATNYKLIKEIDRLDLAAKRTADWANKAENKKIGIDPNKIDNKMGHRANMSAKSKKMMAQTKAIEGRIDSTITQRQSLLKNIERTDTLKLLPLAYNKNTLAEFRDISVSFGDKRVLSSFNLCIASGERIAIAGGNGSGKSTILKLLAQHCASSNISPIAHTGLIIIGKGLKISYVSQDTSILAGSLSDFATKEKIDETLFKTILAKLNFSKSALSNQIQDFSQGQKKKVLLATSLSRPAHLYIWDEPLNYIDLISRIQIENLITTYAPTMLFVEHDEAFSKNVATRVLELE